MKHLKWTLLLVLGYVLIEYYDLEYAYPEVKIFISSQMLRIIYICFLCIWLLCPLIKHFYREYFSFSTICYSIMPGLLLLLGFFAQEHPLIALLILTLILLSICALMWLYQYRSFLRKKKVRKRIIRDYCRWGVSIVAFLLIFPALFSLVNLHVGKSMNNSNMESSIERFLYDNRVMDGYQNEREESPYIANKELLLEFSDINWNRKNIQEKFRCCQLLADFECKFILKIPTPRMKTVDYININGLYDDEKNLIGLSEYYLTGCSAEEAMRTTLHEINHAYNNYLITIFLNDQFVYSDLPYFDHLRELKNNQQNYNIYDDSFLSYSTQPLEADAFAFASEESKNILKIVNDKNRR